MENDRRRGMSSCEEAEFFNRIISRNSSIGCSSRIYYYRSSEGIPFNWEMQPGTPKEPQKEDTLPPISPPPAVLSLGLPKPRIGIADEPKPSKLVRMFKFWKHVNGNSKKLDQADKYYSSYETSSSDDGEFVSSLRRISSSSSSSSFSFSNGSPSPSRDGHYGCSPLHFSSLRVGVSRLRLR
ncbi:hypothetical protein HRI_004847800 [Hibiscus trionum]|uniref:Uncharacterized protein n=1 Tax=Hibiscus trionum TaxID=183268 RepID=A0A9W7MW56_HIBTR|nr:hypothetical protein HRI_004847800 [Hibiscus trionum]